ncbi:MAG: dCTP deaminase [bacterium]|nr:dCTP deaminase [bacterium]
MILPDKKIKELVNSGKLKIEPFDEQCVTPAGYDIKLGNELAIYQPGIYIDVREPANNGLKKVSIPEEGYLLKPMEFVLACTKEYIALPPNIAGFLHARSSIARLGLAVHLGAGFIAPGFEGKLVLEIFNFNSVPVKIYPGMRIAQIIFVELPISCEKSYAEREDSKYKYQSGILPSLIHMEFSGEIVGRERFRERKRYHI